MKVWITKYALSGGVLTFNTDEYKDGEGLSVMLDGALWKTYIGRDHVHATEAAALTCVAAMVEAKRRSLAKQMTALAKVADAVEAGRLPMAKPKKGSVQS